jgi:hypothetical protein
MPFEAGFAEADITPPLGTKKIGWIKEIIMDTALDPLFARAAAFQSGEDRIAFIQLDLLCIRWTEVAEIRRRIEEAYGFPGSAIMVSTTHNHAGPAVVALGEVPLDEGYVAGVVEKVVAAFGEAVRRMQPAKLGLGSVFEWKVSHNRRMVMRDGTVKTHSGYGSPNALYVEGPIDPEVAVLVVKDWSGNTLGTLVNFACHPTDHGGDTAMSAGFPGVLAHEMKDRGSPVTLFLNGAAGNLSAGNPLFGFPDAMEQTGKALADDIVRAMDGLAYRDAVKLGYRSETLYLPFRQITEDELRGTVRGAQRFIDSSIYDRAMPDLVAQIRERGSQLAEVQVLSLDEISFVAVPGELFVQLGLRIKEESRPRRTLMVAFTNGYIGYVPHREAFERGGYETTFGWGSFLAPEAGDMLVECALALLRNDPA